MKTYLFSLSLALLFISRPSLACEQPNTRILATAQVLIGANLVYSGLSHFGKISELQEKITQETLIKPYLNQNEKDTLRADQLQLKTLGSNSSALVKIVSGSFSIGMGTAMLLLAPATPDTCPVK